VFEDLNRGRSQRYLTFSIGRVWIHRSGREMGSGKWENSFPTSLVCFRPKI